MFTEDPEKLRKAAEKEVYSGAFKQKKGYTRKAAKFLGVKYPAGGWFSDDNPWPPGTDHPSLVTECGLPHHFLSEPYQLSFEQLQSLIDYAKKHDLRVDLDGMSTHYPGRTLAVRFFPKDRPL